MRALKVENGVARGAHIGHLLWDQRKFYDSVRLPILCAELLKRDYPKELMVLGYFVHAAPRMLKVGTSYGPVVHSCSRSILAGDQQSVSWTRGLIWDLLDELSKVDPEYPCAAHVDDLSHVLVGESASDLKQKVLKAGRIVGAEVQRLKLTDTFR